MKGEKADNDIIFFSENINSLAYLSKYCNKAKRLKYMFKEYTVDSAGLQEVYVNWQKLQALKTMAET